MKQKIIKIGNSHGIIIPKYILKELGIQNSVNMELTKKGLLITSHKNNSIECKIRDKDEEEALYSVMKSNIDRNIESGKVKWIDNMTMERRID